MNYFDYKSFLLFLILSFLSFSIFQCNGNENTFKNRENSYNLSLLYFIKIRSEGNCLRIETKNSDIKNIYCDRRPMGVCNSNNLIYTNEEKNYRLKEISDLNKKTTECISFILQSGVSTEKVTTENEEDVIKQNNFYKSIESCESTQIATDYNTLTTYDEWIFLNSTLGKIAVMAEIASINPLNQSLQDKGKNCLNTILTDEVTGIIDNEKKKLIENYRNGIKKLNFNCTLGDPGSLNKCSGSLIY
ncbi:MAG: hypothetical protein L6Q54_01975 [Leptospiraceae bacterium]|nr:hypothetical protein [Leptospiraceae bacterium]MCK6380007.1 hypothetical protein [Leptospiraceae bacterium]NUM40150.1 hypothetical protein [Leptospiraceae bacterium]